MCFDNNNYPDFYIKNIRKARNVHICLECNGNITPGDIYEEVRAKWDGEVDTIKTCLSCLIIREKIVMHELGQGCGIDEAQPSHGELLEAARELGIS